MNLSSTQLNNLTIKQVKSLELSLILLIQEYNGEKSDISFFQNSLNCTGLNYSALYTTAVLFEKYILSEIVLNSGRYNINHDSNMLLEIKSCIISSNSNVVMQYIIDGLILNEVDLSKVLDFYRTLQPSEYEQELYLYFNQLFKIRNSKKTKPK